MATTLAEFLSAAAARGFAWGRHDCMLFAADWARALTGRDPAAPWRGKYADEAGALNILSEHGGQYMLMGTGLGRAGWQPITAGSVRDGDIVLAAPPHHNEPVAGVATGGSTALLTRKGLVIAPVRILAAWRHMGFAHG